MRSPFRLSDHFVEEWSTETQNVIIRIGNFRPSHGHRAIRHIL
jgi:hypothetical protein